MPEENLIPASAAPKTAEMQVVAREVFAKAADITVDDDGTFKAAGELLTFVVAQRKKIEETRLSITRPMDEAKSRVMDLFRPIVTTITDAERDLRQQMSSYAELVERQTTRALAEAKAKADAERAAAIAQADILEGLGDTIAAEELRYEAETAPEPAVAVMRVGGGGSGISTRKTYTAEVVDFAELVRYAVASGRVAELLLPNEKVIKAIARAGTSAKIPGVRFVAATGIVSR